MKTRRIIAIALVVLLIGASIVAIVLFSRPKPDQPITIVHTVSYSNAVVFEVIGDFPNRIQREFVPDPARHVEMLLATVPDRPAVLSLLLPTH